MVSVKILLVLLLLSLELAVGAAWQADASNESSGSTSGSLAMNELTPAEREAILKGIDDRKRDGNRLRKGMLCGTFVQPDDLSLGILLENIKVMGDDCHWAVILYAGTEESIEKFCSQVQASSQSIVLCERSSLTDPPRTLWYEKAKRNVSLSTPKSVLYHEFLPWLPRYRTVFLMDSDISLVGFNMSRIRTIWSCTFDPPPLVVQPLVTGHTAQFLTYVNLQPWRKHDRSSVLSSAVGLVEQQVPLFDAEYFEWFVRHVLSNTKPVAMTYGADWGHDRSWCRAAMSYSKYVLQLPHPRDMPCALIVGAPPVQHLNTRTMHNKRIFRDFFRQNAAMVLKKYIELYPTWVSVEPLRPNNPLDPNNREKYKWVHSLRQSCSPSLPEQQPSERK